MDRIKSAHYRANSFGSGIQYLMDGFKLLSQPSLRLFAIIPMVINLLLFVGLTSMLFAYYSLGIQWIENHTWEWLHRFLWVFTVLFSVLFLFAYGYVFNILTNIIGAPFYGLLAEKTEAYLTGEALSQEPLRKMIPRVIGREITKQIYFISRSVLILIAVILISSTGIGSPIGTLISVLWGAWSLCIQYTDYPADNNQLNFTLFRSQLKQTKSSTYGFGGAAMLGTMIPIVNIFIAPAAVCGATIFWVSELKHLREL